MFRDVDALNLKRRCFHKTGTFCNCVTAPSNRMTSQASTAKSPEELAMLAIKAARALQGAMHPPALCAHHITHTCKFTQPWNHTLGYMGEGLAIKIISLNLRGQSDDAWHKTVSASIKRKCTVICMQEINL